MQVDQMSLNNSVSVAVCDGPQPASGADVERWESARDETNAVPPSFEQWLDERLEDRHFGRYCPRQLREGDRQLWYGPLPYESLFPSFTSDDVLLLRAGGQVTTREEWEDVVEAMYRHQWQEGLATWASYQPAPRRELEAIQYAIREQYWHRLEADESSASVEAE